MSPSREGRRPQSRVVFPVEPTRRPLVRWVVLALPFVVGGLVGAAYVGRADTKPALRLSQTRVDSGVPAIVADSVDDSTPAAPAPAPVRAPTPHVVAVKAPPRASRPVERIAPAQPSIPAKTEPAKPEARKIETPQATPAKATPLPATAPPPVAPPVVIPAPPVSNVPGRISVSVTPWGDVSVDGVSAGTSPVINFPLAPGQHMLRITHDGFEPYERTITVTSGDTLRLTDIVLRRRGS